MLIVKAGGGASINWEGVCRDVALEWASGPVVLVHGASACRNALAERLDIPVKTVESPSGISSVYTDEQALDVFLMAYAGLVNKRIVERLQRRGIQAVGLSGADGGLWRARRKKELLARQGERIRLMRNNLSGRVESVNADLLKLLLEAGYLPVISAPALSHEGELVNTDNDTAAAIMAGAMGCRRMIWLFEAPGLLRDIDDPATRIPVIPRARLEEYADYARGRMKKKVLGVALALENGVRKIYWGDGRVEYPLRDALAGKGTIIR